MSGYKRKLRIFNIGRINVVAVTAFFVVLIIGFALNLFVAKTAYLATGSVVWDIVLSVAIVVVGVACHEGLHAVSAMAFGKCARKDIKFGMSLKEGIFYCHCKQPISGKAYFVMLLVPLVVTGIIPFIICVFLGGLMQIAVFSMLIAGAAGDIVMAVGLLKGKDLDKLILDHPKTTAYYVLVKESEADFEEESPEVEEARLSSPEARDGTKLGIKILLITIFVALTVGALFVIGLFMKIV